MKQSRGLKFGNGVSSSRYDSLFFNSLLVKLFVSASSGLFFTKKLYNKPILYKYQNINNKYLKMGVHPYAVLNSSQALAANDTSAETSTGLSYPVVFSPEENAGDLNNTVFPPTTGQLSSSASEGDGLSPYSSQFNSNGQGYYYNVPTNVAAGSDHGTSNAIVAPLCPTVDNIVVDNRTSMPLEPKTPAEYALSILFRQFAKVAEKKLSIIMNHSVV
jgi:hypothetical protein